MNSHTTSCRTHHCGQLRLEDEHKQVKLCGWVQTIRNKGHLLWIDLRDRYGITQLYIERGTNPNIEKKVHALTAESVIQVSGKVIQRTAKNPHIPTGAIEVVPHTLNILSKAKELPFAPQHTDVREELRMQYRYLDLRRKNLQDHLVLRHHVAQEIRSFLYEQHFLEIETPILLKSTPEGARDFIVPSRLYPGQYYALPQSPQLLKQTLMVAGLDRYYQLAKCFRDEDLRADRQPEFTQVDIEASFVQPEDIMDLCEKMIRQLWQKIRGIQLPAFPRITYQKAVAMYGTDKPDLRWDMPFVNLTSLTSNSSFKPFQEATCTLAIRVEKGAQYTRKTLDHLQSFIKEHHTATTNTLIYVKYLAANDIKSSVDKFYNQETLRKWLEKAQATVGDLLLIIGGTAGVGQTLASVRTQLIHITKLPPQKTYAPLWITDFPMFEQTDQGLQAMHHPFTAPREQDKPLLHTKPENVIAQAYDLVINGQELGSGSIRIHQRSLQEKILSLVGLAPHEIKERFGFLLEAFEYGAPIHGGIALGLARICSLLGEGKAIRDYIAFPKNNQGKDVMLGAPSTLT